MPLCRVLVVDDNTHIHRDFRKIVDTVESAAAWSALARDPLTSAPPRAREFDVTCTDSGESALRLVSAALARDQRFHVAFVDMRMPGWDGLATIEQLWRVQPELEVAISSAFMDHSWSAITERLRRPGLRLVPKPWKGSEILATLHELRGRARKQPPRSRPSLTPSSR
jgi:CheY-like chemotaxis protein